MIGGNIRFRCSLDALSTLSRDVPERISQPKRSSIAVLVFAVCRPFSFRSLLKHALPRKNHEQSTGIAAAIRETIFNLVSTSESTSIYRFSSRQRVWYFSSRRNILRAGVSTSNSTRTLSSLYPPRCRHSSIPKFGPLVRGKNGWQKKLYNHRVSQSVELERLEENTQMFSRANEVRVAASFIISSIELLRWIPTVVAVVDNKCHCSSSSLRFRRSDSSVEERNEPVNRQFMVRERPTRAHFCRYTWRASSVVLSVARDKITWPSLRSMIRQTDGLFQSSNDQAALGNRPFALTRNSVAVNGLKSACSFQHLVPSETPRASRREQPDFHAIYAINGIVENYRPESARHLSPIIVR